MKILRHLTTAAAVLTAMTGLHCQIIFKVHCRSNLIAERTILKSQPNKDSSSIYCVKPMKLKGKNHFLEQIERSLQ